MPTAPRAALQLLLTDWQRRVPGSCCCCCCLLTAAALARALFINACLKFVPQADEHVDVRRGHREHLMQETQAGDTGRNTPQPSA